MPEFHAADGTRLSYRDDGTGLPVIALAGLTRNGDDFNFVAPHLGGVRLIRPDYRGRGRSQWPGPETYTIPHEASDVLALMDHLELEKAAILGTSRGGLIGMGLAAQARDRITGLCLNDIGPVIEDGGLAAIMTYLGRRPEQASLDEAARARARVMQAAGFQNVPPARWRQEVTHVFATAKDGLDLRYDSRLRDAVEAASAQPLPDLWPLFDACAGLPLALIHGAGSNILGDATVAEMRARRPDMIYARVPGRGHAPFLDEPAALAALNSWLGEMR